MKQVVLFAVLALAAVASGAVVQTAVGRYNLNEGYISPGDRVLYRNYFYKAGYPHAVQTQDVSFRGSRSTVITAVHAVEIGHTRHASAQIISGGIRRHDVTIRLTSTRGYGYFYQIDIWGH